MRRHTFEAIFHEMGFPAKRTWWKGAVAYSVARTYSLLVRELEQIYARFGLSPSSFNLLMLVKHGADPDSHTQREIGSRLVVSASDMTGLIDRLERKGLVRRTPGRDRRSKLLKITPAGSKLVDEIWPHHEQMVKRLTDTLDERQAEMLVKTLSHVRQAAASCHRSSGTKRP